LYETFSKHANAISSGNPGMSSSENEEKKFWFSIADEEERPSIAMSDSSQPIPRSKASNILPTSRTLFSSLSVSMSLLLLSQRKPSLDSKPRAHS
jgi:hypothetical protein